MNVVDISMTDTISLVKIIGNPTEARQILIRYGPYLSILLSFYKLCSTIYINENHHRHKVLLYPVSIKVRQ